MPAHDDLDRNDFDTPWLLTQGGPASATENLILLAYRYTFGRNNVGMGSATSFITLLILMILVSFFFADGANPEMARKLRSPQRLGLTALTAAIVVIANFPVIFMVLNSLQTTEQLMTKRSFIPTHPTLANFVYLSARTSFWTYLRTA